jgi:hypothetical protein
VTCVDEADNGRNNSISLERGLGPQDNCTITILHWVLSVYEAHVVYVLVKHVKTKTS